MSIMLLESKRPEMKNLYEKYNDFFETFSKLIYFAFTYIGLPSAVFFKAIIAILKYYTTDAGRDAFELPFDIW